MGFQRRGLRVRALLMLLLLGVTPASALARGSVAQGAPDLDVAVAVSTRSSDVPMDPSGSGAWERAACLACAAGFVMLGGTSILGLAAAILTMPEFAAGCGATCAYAFG